MRVRVGDLVHVDVAGRSVAIGLTEAPDVDRAAHASAAAAGVSADLAAPMPGQVLSVHVAPGALVVAGDPVVTLEAMKMEHVVATPIDGAVTELLAAPGDQVVRGQRLATIDPPP